MEPNLKLLLVSNMGGACTREFHHQNTKENSASSILLPKILSQFCYFNKAIEHLVIKF